MNILTDQMPKNLNICGEDIEIRSDFKTWIKFTLICQKKIGAKEVAKILALIFLRLPKRLDKAMEAVFNFYVPKKLSKSKKNVIPAKKIYDFEIDSELIYSAFMQQYGIDLTTADLHWWQFKALLDGLNEETQFVKVLQYRSMDISQIKDKNQKNFYMNMKNIYKLPDERSEEEKENDLNNSLEGLF